MVRSNLKLTWEYHQGCPVLVQQPDNIEPFNDVPGNPVNIQIPVGLPPVLTIGDRNVNNAVMEFVASSGNPFLNLFIHQDNAEYEYACNTSVEQTFAIAAKLG